MPTVFDIPPIEVQEELDLLKKDLDEKIPHKRLIIIYWTCNKKIDNYKRVI